MLSGVGVATAQEQRTDRSQPDERQGARLRGDRHPAYFEIVGPKAEDANEELLDKNLPAAGCWRRGGEFNHVLLRHVLCQRLRCGYEPAVCRWLAGRR